MTSARELTLGRTEGGVSASRAHNRVRPLRADDLEDVARLFLERFRTDRVSRSAAARREVAQFMQRLYLQGPAAGSDPDSLVQITERGDVGAFVGVMRAAFTLDGKPVSVGVTGALMTAADPRNGLAAVQLLRELRHRSLDLVYTDTANRASLALCQASKYKVLSPESLEWACVFKPASAAVHKLGQRAPFLPKAMAASAAGLLDAAVSKWLRRAPPRRLPAGWRDEEADASGFVEAAPIGLEKFRLRPAASSAHLHWLVAMAAERESAGPMHLRVLRDRSGVVAGHYAFHGEAGGVARVFQAVATPGNWGVLIDGIVETTRELGCVGVHGCARGDLLPHLYAIPGLFLYYAGGALYQTPRADIAEAIESGSAFLGGLNGDRWTRLATDRFGASRSTSGFDASGVASLL